MIFARTALENMKKHMADNHIVVPESERTCGTCGKITANRKGMLNHFRRVHVDRTFDCTECDKSFKRKIYLTVSNFFFEYNP
jgi:hypothetical protein